MNEILSWAHTSCYSSVGLCYAVFYPGGPVACGFCRLDVSVAGLGGAKGKAHEGAERGVEVLD